MADNKDDIIDAHNQTIRYLEDAEDLLAGYRQKSWAQIDSATDAIYSHYKANGLEVPQKLSTKYEEAYNDYMEILKEKGRELEEARDEEDWDFKRKMMD